VVIDPNTRRLTHLVVQPHDRHDQARLIPIGHARVDERSNIGVWLDCTIAELNEREPLHASQYVRLGERPAEPGSEIGIEDGFELPSYQSLGTSGLGAGMGPLDTDPHVTLSYDRIPSGMVELRRESEVTSSDGHNLGHVVGFVVGDQEQIAQVVLEHGHLWGKREIAIPSRSIDRIQSDEVLVTLCKHEVGR
jgi:hypothetical protein